jgi:phage terminase large subunit-like protein
MPRPDGVDAGLRAMLDRLSTAPVPRPRFTPLPHQQPPPWDDDSWDTWIILAGRGSGKTLASCHYLNEIMSTHKGWYGRIIAPSIGDGRESCVVGPSGLLAINPKLRWRTNEGAVIWPNGSRVRVFGAYTPEDVERLRAGGNSYLDVWEELAAWPKLDECLDQAAFGLRLGRHPRAIVATTPKPRERLRALLKEPGTRITRASTRDNPHLASRVRKKLEDAYAGTRIGRQELDAEMLDDVEGALWSSSMIDPYRVLEIPWDQLVRVVVAVDPAKTRRRESDLTGIIVVGRGLDGHGYVLADLSGRYSPAQWASIAIKARMDFRADAIVAETNIAGDLVTEVIRAVDEHVNVRPVRSHQSKRGRALPAVALYQQKRCHHVGYMEALEDQMYAFTGSGDTSEADDRVDALVLALHDLQLTYDAIMSRGWRTVE